ncbi:MAG TPA: hypothetical protein VNG53_11355 [Bacteroidia bacterium]|nr:hypothetical protein [Bacteroidia bacterium]
MRVKVRIVTPDNLSNSDYSFELCELPTTLSFIVTNKNEIFIILQTLFTRKSSEGFYEFEQIIGKFPKQRYEKYSLQLLIGNVYLDYGETIFKEVITKDNIFSEDNIIKIPIDIPFNYILENDMIKENEKEVAYIQNKCITNTENIIEVHPSKFPIDSFRKGDKIPPK